MRRSALSVLAAVAALVLVPAPQAVAQQGALDLSGELHGVPYEIRVPADWNGTLVLFAHGYRDRADHPGETDDRSAQAFGSEASEQAMLAAGYAIAGSAYATNGWAVSDGIEDTKDLAHHFAQVVAKPTTTLLAGFSMGSVVAFESIERFPELYDGAMPSCAVGAGTPRAFDGTLAISSAYAAVFGWPASWGTPADVRDDLDFDTEVLPVLIGQLTAPGGAAKFEFIRLVTGVPRGPEWPFSIWFFTTEGRAELERRAGGPVAQNLDHTYSMSPANRAFLNGIGVTNEQIDGYIATMMSTRVGAPPAPRQYAERYADYTGKLRSPVLTLDTTTDALVAAAHISAYNATVAAAGRSELLANAWTTGVGHCNFTPQQLVTATQALERWVQTGQRPGAFPSSQGFTEFTPPPWPQP
jgi:pimeloyl-ACP methyl ester carboxylesterase